MATPIKCAKGHWYEPDPSGKAASCPHCQAEARRRGGKPISEDDVMGFLNDPGKADAAQSSSDEPELHQKPRKCALKRHKKICQACHCETSFAFEYCPRCGGPLEIAVIEVP
jgi:hypothetical protein